MSFCLSLLAPGEPGSVKLAVISSTQLNLTWASPSDPNGVITGYRVIWRMVRDNNDVFVNDSSSRTEIINNGDAVLFAIVNLGKCTLMTMTCQHFMSDTRNRSQLAYFAGTVKTGFSLIL